MSFSDLYPMQPSCLSYMYTYIINGKDTALEMLEKLIFVYEYMCVYSLLTNLL